MFERFQSIPVERNRYIKFKETWNDFWNNNSSQLELVLHLETHLQTVTSFAW